MKKGLLKRRRGSYLSQEGAALVIVLCFVVLLTVLIVAFLLQSTLSRQIFNARAGQTEVDVLSDSAVQFMKADLRQEIVSGSIPGSTYIGTDSSGTAVPLYVPSSNTNVVPSRTGFTPGSTAAADPYANIVKICKYKTDFFSGPGFTNLSTYPSTNYVSQVSTATPSLNGRYIDSTAAGWTTNGWDKPQLIDTTAYPTALANAPLPDWVYVTTAGRKIITAPESDVVGRYSFVVYDEGGLLDINSAGYNSALSTADAYDVARKGSLGLADLTQIPGITPAIRDALIAWRNNYTASSSYTTNTTMFTTNTSSFLQYLVDGSFNSGFLKTYPGDEKFISRQDLLAYQAAGSSGLTNQSLAYLGTFSRTINAPTYTPIDSPGETFTPATTYAANAELLDWPSSLSSSLIEPIYNRDVPNVRWSADVTIKRPVLSDDTGTQTETVTFHKGDPLIQHRFPLSKIQLLSLPAAKITANANTPGTVAWAVLYYFGMKWNSSPIGSGSGLQCAPTLEPHWEYEHARPFETGDGAAGSGTKYQNSIGQVAQVVTGASNPQWPNDTTFVNREPDFFELLQAGTLRGSTTEDNLMDIGMCIIDQTTATDVPTLMCFGPGGIAREWLGRKNLPYFDQLLLWPYRSATPNANREYIEVYLVPVIWNPHRNATTLPAGVKAFRMYLCYTSAGGVVGRLGPAKGGFFTTNAVGAYYSDTYPSFTYTAANEPGTNSVAVTSANSQYIIPFNPSTDYQEPTVLNSSYVPNASSIIPTDPNTGGPVGGLTDNSVNRWGFFVGSRHTPDGGVANRMGVPITYPVQWTGSPTSWPTNTTMSIVGPTTSAGSFGFRLQCEDENGVWHTYADIAHSGLGDASPGGQFTATDSAGAKINITGTTLNSAPCFSGVALGANATNYYGAVAMGPVDPRVNNATGSPTPSRYGTSWEWNTSIGGSSTAVVGASIRPKNNTGSTVQVRAIGAGGVIDNWGTPSSAIGDYSAMSSENSSSGGSLVSAYGDNAYGAIVGSNPSGLQGDGVVRPGDGAYGAFPMATSNPQDRPIILNRPFLSVGELGYTFRTLEWKTLDFSSASSADSGLLDLFSINDTENANQQSMISGVFDLNTHNPAVLQALLSGGLVDGLGTTTLSTTDASAVANAIVNETAGSGAGPLLNRAQLATRVMPLSGVTAALANDGYVTKDRREAVVRALAEPSDTRTWNLLIDLVIQAGRYPTTALAAGASALGQFDVQGERHYWLHLAIDRYSGKVIDEQLEIVRDN